MSENLIEAFTDLDVCMKSLNDSEKLEEDLSAFQDLMHFLRGVLIAALLFS